MEKVQASVIIFVITCILGGSLAVPIPNQEPASAFPCQQVSFTQKTGEITTRYNATSSDLPCVPIFSDLPTAVRLITQATCQYHVVHYSQAECTDDSEVTTSSISTTNPETILNERRRHSICSYELQSKPARRSWVTVAFTKGNGTKVHRILSRGCHNICSDSSGTFFPDNVGVYRRDTSEVVTDNSIKLFSGINCQDDTDIKNTNGDELWVTKETDLATLTQITPHRRVRSFKLERL